MRKVKQRLAAIGSAAVMAVGAIAVPLSVGMPATVADDEETPLFWNTDYSFEERAADLVSRLTLEEKVAQLGNSAPAISRLGIKKYGYWNEGLHGVANTKKSEGQFATSFPYSIAMAASWDPELIEAIGSASGDEARAYSNKGLRDLSYWCPTINMSRDPRWGRNHEGYGEDNFLTSQIAIGFVNGYQGVNDENVEKNEDGTNKYLKVISTLKHYAANNSEYNREDGSSTVSNQYLRDYFTRAFKKVIQSTDINSVMSAYNMVNGVPSSGSYYLLDTLLRKTFGFDGYVVSDCGAIGIISAKQNHYWKPSDWNLPDANGLYEGAQGYQPIDYTPFEDETGHVTAPGSVALCLAAGCDMDCGAYYPTYSVEAVEAGILSEDTIDRALVRIFTARMETGEFDPDEMVSYRGDTYSWDNQVESEDHIQLAEDSATQTIVMMKNEPAQGEDTPILPLSKEEKNIVMVGPLVQQNILGGYSGTPSDENLSTPQQGVEKILGQGVTYISGTSASNAYMPNLKSVTLKDKEGKVLSTLAPSDVAAYTGCELDGTSNFRYIQPEAVISFSDVYMKDTALVELEIAGGSRSLQGHIEVRYGDVNGGVLADIETINTGSDTTYKTVSGFNSNGNYERRDIHVVFHSNETTISFTAQEQSTIQNADAVIVCIGGVNSAEGNDRSSIALWNSQDELVKQVALLNPRTICHLQTVGVVEIEAFKDITPAILWTCNNGQAQGNALARVLFGDANPSAKLPFTWYAYNSQLETIDDYDLASEDYKYGGWTYQYFTGQTSYPFGHGLSYSDFAYSDLQLDTTSVTPDDTIKATVKVTNTSDVDGKEIVELYVKSPEADGVDRPLKQLKAFEKVEIKAHETKTVELTLPLSDCYFWDEALQKNVWDQGKYTVFVGPSSDETDENAQEASFTLSGQPKEAISVVQATPSGTTLNAAKPGKTVTTDLAVTMQDDTILDADSDKLTVTYVSNRPDVAAVDQNGVVTPVSKGVATITVTAKLADGVEVSDSYAVAVIDELSLDDLQVNGQTISGFAPTITEYYVPVAGTDVPEVTYDAGGAQATLTNATAIPGDATIVLTKGDQTVTYTIHFLEKSEEYEVVTFSQMDGTYTSDEGNHQLYADWKLADQITGSVKSINFYEHNMSDLHLRATVTLSKPNEDIPDATAYGKGWIKLRSVDNNGENNAGWDLDKVDLGLKTGVNYLDIPLTLPTTTTKGTMDWSAVDRCIFVINTADLGAGYTMKLEDVRVVDTSLGGVRDELWAAINDKVDTSAYTPESAQAYTEALQAAMEAVLDENATDDQLRACIQPLKDARQHLEPLTYTVETFSQAAKTFESYNISDSSTEGKNETVGTNWKQTDNTLLNALNNRDKYYLQMTLKLGQKNQGEYPYAPKDAWKSITVKLRSSNKSNVSNDPNGAENTEHNVGWDLYPTMLNKEDPFGNDSGVEFTSTDGGATLKISIPLDTPITNSRGVMQWDDIREIYINVNLIDAIRNEKGETTEETNELRKSHSYVMTVIDPVVVDMTYVTEQKKDLNAVMMQAVDTDGADAAKVEAYNTALETAQKVYATDFSTPFDVYDAQKSLEAAIDDVTGGEGGTTSFAALDEELLTARRLDKTAYTEDSWAGFEQVFNEAKALRQQENVTQRQVNDMVERLQAAFKQLEYAPVDDPTHVRVNFTNIGGKYTLLVGGTTLWPDWTSGDGLSKDDQEGGGVDLSGTAANGANKNMALYATIRMDAPDGVDPYTTWKTIKFRLRSSQVDGKEQAAKFYEFTPSQVTRNDDGSFCVEIPLSAITTENINWSDVKQLHIECLVADAYQIKGQGNVDSPDLAMTVSDVYIAAISEGQTDVSALKAALLEAEQKDEADYTADSWAEFAAALEKAEAVYDNLTATQDEVDEAASALTKAMDALVEQDQPPVTADKTQLNAAIAAAMALTEEDLKAYTADSVTAFKAALEQAQSIAEKSDATQTEVDNASKALTDAQEALIRYGDVNKDGSVTSADALMALQAATGKITLIDGQPQAANVDGEGNVTSADALMILQHATQKILSFPVEK